MNLVGFEKRIRGLEREFLRRTSGKECNCRFGMESRYHTAGELAQIMNTRCSVHGFRDLGRVTWVSVGLPLRPEDQALCSCVRSDIRDFLEGRRGPLTEKEQEKDSRSWEAEFTKEADQNFKVDQVQVRRLLSQYERIRRRAHEK